MTQLALLTKETIDSLLAQHQGTLKARGFLDQNFGFLSEPERQALTEPALPERVQAVEKILEDLRLSLEDLKARDLQSFVRKKFPFLADEELREFILELSQPVPAIPPRRPPWLHIELLIDQALGALPLIMEKEEGYAYLVEEFPSLADEDLEWLAQPQVKRRQKAMQKLVRHMGDEAREQRVGDLRKMLKVRFRDIDPDEVERILPDIVRNIPPRRPKPPEKPKRIRGAGGHVPSIPQRRRRGGSG